MFFLRSTLRLLASVLLPLAGIVGPLWSSAAAQQAEVDERVEFNIPSQSLDSALAQYFQITGVQLLYDSGLTQGRRSATVRGRYAPREALRLLLMGTGLVVRYSRANAAIITRPETSTATPLVPLGRVFVRERIGSTRLAPVERMAYYQQIEAELEAFLRGDRRTARLAFSVNVQLRITEDGTLAEIEVSRSGGDRKIDRILTETLQDAKVTPPSPQLDQPLRLALKGVRH